MNKFSISSAIKLYFKPIQFNSIQGVYAKPQKSFALKLIDIIGFTQLFFYKEAFSLLTKVKRQRF